MHDLTVRRLFDILVTRRYLETRPVWRAIVVGTTFGVAIYIVEEDATLPGAVLSGVLFGAAFTGWLWCVERWRNRRA